MSKHIVRVSTDWRVCPLFPSEMMPLKKKAFVYLCMTVWSIMRLASGGTLQLSKAEGELFLGSFGPAFLRERISEIFHPIKVTTVRERDET